MVTSFPIFPSPPTDIYHDIHLCIISLGNGDQQQKQTYLV
jgi:hypothetical protein